MSNRRTVKVEIIILVCVLIGIFSAFAKSPDNQAGDSYDEPDPDPDDGNWTASDPLYHYMPDQSQF